mmetsp:Transcript_30153/g.61503  ORF Transcript_30153/g.61503 Transcript_30153/m.61503 type:complete len:200 (-) Transcript_30153:180-779(-)|eukprot:CAMPEP_0183294146 /NCGR_PEP_ID=MMETSP0160_2-20130417/2588_1 /TAXON_ID=2839 ORGANISM="Odontella Sinensis, Strain Grunow 1884" /NCGR_SAMPLE_ID=MMETSP0160_2 /ASSEMBLY_ACC=CAM_ASM_000250 /LENGTH=199 /DNA_ID=CAMNT_0025455407 /DNA_START=34 /DNA_END=633 /DNA_ORIENTATION=-
MGGSKIKGGMKPSSTTYATVVGVLSAFSLFGGYFAATQPTGAGWREPFSYHPLLMTVGFVGLMGTAAITKKLGGYTNTKIHGVLSGAGFFAALGGLYAIYRNKELMGKEHFTSTHSWGGAVALLGCAGPMMVGGIFLHPDWGIDKNNKLFRMVHKWFGRIAITIGWVSCLVGLTQLTEDGTKLAMFGVPLLFLFPFVLV